MYREFEVSLINRFTKLFYKNKFDYLSREKCELFFLAFIPSAWLSGQGVKGR